MSRPVGVVGQVWERSQGVWRDGDTRPRVQLVKKLPGGGLSTIWVVHRDGKPSKRPISDAVLCAKYKLVTPVLPLEKSPPTPEEVISEVRAFIEGVPAVFALYDAGTITPAQAVRLLRCTPDERVKELAVITATEGT